MKRRTIKEYVAWACKTLTLTRTTCPQCKGDGTVYRYPDRVTCPTCNGHAWAWYDETTGAARAPYAREAGCY